MDGDLLPVLCFLFMKLIFRLIILAVALMVSVAGAQGERISQKEAAKVAWLFSKAISGKEMDKPQFVYNGKKLTTDHLFTPFYGYNLEDGGFVIISGDNKAMPVLGYSMTGHLDPDHLSDTQLEWLRQYAKEIEMIRYDSRVPDEAIAAWGDIRGYIGSLVSARENVSKVLFSPSETLKRLEDIDESSDASLTESVIYTPQQWQEMVGDELRQRGNVAIGLEKSNGTLLPVLIHGHRGDYYALATDNFVGKKADNVGQWMMRLNATEFITAPALADIGNPIELTYPEPTEESGLAWQDSFLAEVRDAEAQRIASIEEVAIPSKPRVRSLGGGHFEIFFPEDIKLAYIYNVGGALIGQQTFRSTSVGHFDLSIQPGGFYLLLVEGESGEAYGLKLYR